MSEPVWVRPNVLKLLHGESIAEHGGADGLRDEGLFETALARPQNLFAYEGVDDVARLAAAYAFGLAKNHAFVDGNKRIAFIACAMFLRLNGLRLVAEQSEAVLTFLALAAGDLDEKALADWVRKHAKPL
jgi:death-on-curing protein